MKKYIEIPMGLLEDHTRDAKNALIDREIIDFV